MLPEIMKTATNPQAGAKILSNMGVDKSFIHDTFNKYSKYASFVPGLNADSAKSMLGALTGAMGEDNTPKETKQPVFDSKKYPKI